LSKKSTKKTDKQPHTKIDVAAAIRDFEKYLSAIKNIDVKVLGIDKDDNAFIKNKDYGVRWSPSRRRLRNWRFFRVQDMYVELGCPPVSMASLTTYQRNRSYEQQYELVRDGRDFFLKCLHKDYPDIPYVWVAEAHESGYLHYHILIMGAVSLQDLERYRFLYAKKEFGSYENGLLFTFIPRIKTAVGYLIKYMSVDAKHQVGDKIMNAMIFKMWHTEGMPHLRSYGYSRSVSNYIKSVAQQGPDTNKYDYVYCNEESVYQSGRIVLETGTEKYNAETLDFNIPRPLKGTPVKDQYYDLINNILSLDI